MNKFAKIVEVQGQQTLCHLSYEDEECAICVIYETFEGEAHLRNTMGFETVKEGIDVFEAFNEEVAIEFHKMIMSEAKKGRDEKGS